MGNWKSILLKNEFLFINAWNEWGEGMYLEPDERNGYKYLNSICGVIEKYENENISIGCDNWNLFYEGKPKNDEDILLKKLQKLLKLIKIINVVNI